MKKVLSILLAMVMVLSMTTAAFAAFTGKDAPAASTANVTINKVAKETTGMTAYSVIKASDNGKGVVTYTLEDWAKTALAGETWTDGQGNAHTLVSSDESTVDIEAIIQALGGEVAIAGGQKTQSGNTPTNMKNSVVAKLSAAWTNLSKKPTVQSYTATLADDTASNKGEKIATFTDVEVGYYLVEPSDSVNVYNPMTIAVGLGADATTGEYNSVKAQNSTAKFTQVGLDKKQTNADRKPNVSGDYQVGDTVTYEIDTNIPDYDLSRFTNPCFYLEDTLTAGLDNVAKIKVTIGDRSANPAPVAVEWNSGDKSKTDMPGVVMTWDTSKNYYKIDFSAALAGANSADYLGKPVHIEYETTVNQNALTGFDPNTNTAELTFDRTPNGKDGNEEITTYAYTFSIDGSILGNYSHWGEEVKKTGVNEWTTTTGDLIKSQYEALKDAEFTLYTDAGCTQPVPANKLKTIGSGYSDTTATTTNPTKSDSQGRIIFEGLDGVKRDDQNAIIGGVYYLKETNAPSGYSLNTTVTKVYFEPTAWDTDGKMTEYKVYINDSLAATFTYVPGTASTPASVNPVYTEKAKQFDGTTVIGTTEIKNTKLVSLPSTGGMGTTLFTVAGCLIMIAAAGMFFVSRRKEER